MTTPVRQTRSFLIEMFRERGLNPRHDLGQNFLIDLNLLEGVVRAAELEERDVVLEIGAGTGGLTTFLAAAAGAVVSVELDRNLHAIAASFVEGMPHVTLLNCDALAGKHVLNPLVVEAVSSRLRERPNSRLKLVANLPYSVATPVISNLVASDLPWARMVVTVQHELGLRLFATPGDSHFGGLAVWLQSQCRVRQLHRLPPSVFWPRPQVDSAVIQIDPDPARAALIADRRAFQVFNRQLFLHRRKQVQSVLKGMAKSGEFAFDVEGALSALGVAGISRAEELDVDTIVRLANRWTAGRVTGSEVGGDDAASE
jgi:16S rRNA (adenine1518-N6/adenine1519-N6)-dimethyltransferase